MLKTIVYIALGGAIGSVMRYLTSIFISKFWTHNFPLATFLTNILGCFLIGLLAGFFLKDTLENSNLKWFLITGFCGGYTTFSTFGLENVNLIQSNNSFLSLTYIGLSIFMGILSVWLGLFLTK